MNFNQFKCAVFSAAWGLTGYVDEDYVNDFLEGLELKENYDDSDVISAAQCVVIKFNCSAEYEKY